MHTGSTFTRMLLSTCSNANPVRRKVSACDVTQDEKLKVALSTYNIIRTKCGKEHSIFATHHNKINKPLILYLKNNICPIPVILTLRDPILTANTFTWRRIIGRRDPEEIIDRRKQKIKITVDLMLEGIDLYKKGYCFMFPIDLKNSKKIALNIFDYCNFRKTKKTYRFIKNWKPYNVSAHVMLSKNKSIHQTCKKAIETRDILTVEKLLEIEFNYLRKQDKLKSELETLGYKDLIWW